MKKIPLLLFFLLSIIYFIGEFLPSKTLIFATKPLLMFALLVYIYMSTKENSTTFIKLIMLGFFFSIGGDTLLMFVENDPSSQIFFLLGLGSFLLAHLFYLQGFLKYPSNQKGLVSEQRKWIIPFVFLLLFFLNYLWTDLPDDFKIPVGVYACAIIAMAISSLNMSGKVSKQIAQTIFIGAMLFLFSDLIIGLNKFKTNQLQIPEPRLMIMIPYLLGQYLIAKGSVEANELIE